MVGNFSNPLACFWREPILDGLPILNDQIADSIHINQLRNSNSIGEGHHIDPEYYGSLLNCCVSQASYAAA